MIKLEHLSSRRVAESGVFKEIKDYEAMVKSIARFGHTLGDGYNDFVGGAFEVYTEFFFKRYGTRANPHLQVLYFEDTSSNKFEVGIDFRYKDFAGNPAVLQSKFRSNPQDKFMRNDLGTFVSVCDEEEVQKKNRILFTTLEHHSAEDGVFHFSWPKGNMQMRVIGRNHQEEFLDRDPTFWSDFNASLEVALRAPTDFKTPPPFWTHQERMSVGAVQVRQDGGRGRIICATGGGKTRVIYQSVMDGFAEGLRTQVVVAPTIDLLRQHHAYFEQYGAFHNDGVNVIHFRTGESCEDGWAEVYQTTSVKDAIDHFSFRTLIFVTYASEQKLFDGLIDKDETVDVVYWDEFHHTVQQKTEQRDHMLSIPSARNLFFSASIKRGRMMSGTDEELYGPLLAEVKYSELRKTGVLVPKILIKTVFIAREKIHHLERVMKKAAKKENFDLTSAVVEAGGTIAAFRDMRASGKNCNAVTFSKAVAICKEIVSNNDIRGEFNCHLNTVHAGVPGRERKAIYEEIKNADNSVLCQFSVVKEGIDINPFNCVIFSRNMDVIGTQQAIGRAVRANPDDTKALQAGLISIDDPTGWKKYDATLYVIMHDSDAGSFRDFLIEMVQKLQFAGLEDDDYEFSDITEAKHGTSEDDDTWVAPTDEIRNIINVDSVRDAVKAATIELQAQQEYDDARAEYDSKSINEKLLMLGAL